MEWSSLHGVMRPPRVCLRTPAGWTRDLCHIKYIQPETAPGGGHGRSPDSSLANRAARDVPRSSQMRLVPDSHARYFPIFPKAKGIYRG